MRSQTGLSASVCRTPFTPYQGHYHHIEQRKKPQHQRWEVDQSVQLVTNECGQHHQGNREHPSQPAQQTGHERQLDGAVHQQIGGGKMLRTGGQVLRHAHRVGSEKIGRVFDQFLVRQPLDHLPDLGPGRQEQDDSSDQFDTAVHALENHARQKSAVGKALRVCHEP